MQQSSLSSSSASSSISCTSLQSTGSCKNSPKSMAGCAPAQRPLPEIAKDVNLLHASSCCRFIASNDGPSKCSIRKSSAASSYGELDCPLKQCDKYAEAQVADGSGNLDQMCEGNPTPTTHFKPRPTVPSANPNCVEHPGRELVEEGEGECHGDHIVSSSVNRSPSLWDNCEDSIRMSWRRLSPAAASCFCKDIEEEQEYFQQVLGSSSHGWTDEKHSSYLDSMEADFLKSVMFKGGPDVVHTEPSSDLDDSASSHQAKAGAKEFKVCQSGKWRPVLVQASFVNVSPLKQLAVAVKNPWIKRFRASGRAYDPSLIMEDPLIEELNACGSSQRHE